MCVWSLLQWTAVVWCCDRFGPAESTAADDAAHRRDVCSTGERRGVVDVSLITAPCLHQSPPSWPLKHHSLTVDKQIHLVGERFRLKSRQNNQFLLLLTFRYIRDLRQTMKLVLVLPVLGSCQENFVRLWSVQILSLVISTVFEVELCCFILRICAINCLVQ